MKKSILSFNVAAFLSGVLFLLMGTKLLPLLIWMGLNAGCAILFGIVAVIKKANGLKD